MTICPINKKAVGDTCSVTGCPFYSVKEDTGCFYGDDTTITNVAYHKGMKTSALREYVENVDNLSKHYLLIYKYAEYVKEKEPTNKELLIWSRLRIRKPYCLPEFQFIKPSHFARMKNGEAFYTFQSTLGISLDMNVEDFLKVRKIYNGQ